MAVFFASERDYLTAFDRFEYLAALVFADFYDTEHPTYGTVWVPLGRYAERYSSLFAEVQAEISRQRDGWPLLRAGLFGGSLDRVLALKQKVDEWARGVAIHHGFWS
jgi:hypothetical protein